MDFNTHYHWLKEWGINPILIDEDIVLEYNAIESFESVFYTKQLSENVILLANEETSDLIHYRFSAN